jgi:hypothetical protein
MSKHHEMQAFIRYYKQETGVKEVDLREVAKFAALKGWPLPDPIDPIDRLAKDFSAAAREETREDKATGQSYRVNHVYTVTRGGEQLRLWVDIDEAPREPMHRSLTIRREQIVGDITQLSFDAEHWNRVNPEDDPIEIEKDFGLDVEIRRNAAEYETT